MESLDPGLVSHWQHDHSLSRADLAWIVGHADGDLHPIASTIDQLRAVPRTRHAVTVVHRHSVVQ